MKKVTKALLCSFLFVISNTSFSQNNQEELLPMTGNNERCTSERIHQELLKNDSIYNKIRTQDDNKANDTIQNSFSFYIAEEVLNIPVVVHVIHKSGEGIGTGTNISDAQIISAINDLNNKFGTSNTGVNSNITFCLAKRTPNGDPTNGILRVNGSGISNYNDHGIIYDSNYSLPTNNIDVKALSKWPNDKYYNIWIVNEINGNNGGGGTQGYAYFPGASSTVDGAVILYNAFGYDPDGLIGHNLKTYTRRNTVAAHEIGHGLNLYHTFQGDDDGNVCPSNLVCGNNSDCVNDTDPHKRSDGNCGSSGQTCFGAGTNLADIVTNIMSYSSETCQTKFSQGQKNRMREVLESGGLRESLTS